MDTWGLERRGNGHMLWVRISSTLNTGEAASSLGCPEVRQDC